MIKNIIFDIGNVLVRFRPEESMRDIGIESEKIPALSEATFRSKWWQELDRGFIPEQTIVDHMVAESPELEQEIRLFFEKGISGIVETFEYTRQWMSDLKKQGLHIYLLSNYPETFFIEHWEKEYTFTDLVDGKVVSYDVKKIKPDPAIYELLLAKYDLKPEECIFFDDRKENVLVASLLGIHGIQFTEYEDACGQLESTIREAV